MNLLGAAILLVDALIVAALGRAKPLAIAVRAVAIVVGSWVVLILTMRLDTPWGIEPEVLSFWVGDRLRRPPEDAIVFTGSSTIAHWSSLRADMAPLPVLNRGISGSRAHQISFHADRLVLPYHPSAVVFYAGENDIVGVFWSAKKSPAQVLAAFRGFCEKVHAQLPDVPIYFVSIKPQQRSPQWWPAIDQANALVRDYCGSDVRLHFIDVVPAMLDAEGRPRGDIFERDGIHLNTAGYHILTTAVKPALMGAFQGAVPIRTGGER